MDLTGKVAIVTGSGQGIGRAIALKLAEVGATVVVNDISEALEAVAEEIKTKGSKAKAIQTDISDHEQVKRMVAQTVNEFWQIDILVNNAARGTFNNADVVDMNLDEWHDSLAINLTGIMFCSREVLKYMIPRKSGSIIKVGKRRYIEST